MSLQKKIGEYAANHPDECESAEKILTFLSQEKRHFHREQLDGHITASAIVVNQNLTKILLTYHAKFDKWMQLGGHADGDSDTIRVAHREGYEESGLPPEEIKLFNEEIFDLDIHDIPEKGNEPAHMHYDIGYIFQAHDKVPLQISAESKDLGWKSVDELLKTDTLQSRMRRMLEKVRHISSMNQKE